MTRPKMRLITLWLFLLVMPSIPLKPANSLFAVNGQGNRQRNVNMHFEQAGATRSFPAEEGIVTVNAGAGTFQNRTDRNGNVRFRGVPCGGTLAVLFDQGDTSEELRKTIPFPCGTNALTVEFFLCERVAFSSEQPNLNAGLFGITTQRVRFQRGRNEEGIRDSIANNGIKNYLLDARRGQEISLHLTSNDKVRFDFFLQRDPEATILNSESRAVPRS
jgi:hypothetical protein